MKKVFFFSMILFALNVTAQDKMQISKGTTVTGSNDAVIVFEDVDLVNEGDSRSITGSTFLFTGVRNASISGNRFSVENLWLDKNAGSMLSMDADLDIHNLLQFTNGRIDLRHHIINLGNTGKLANENENSYVFSTGNGYLES